MQDQDSQTLEQRYKAVKARIPRAVTLVAVSKGQSVDQIEALYQLGHRDFGENYAQELVQKQSVLALRGCADITWHFIGHLQSNKVKALMPIVSVIHSVDSVELAQEIAHRWRESKRVGKIGIFLEVNIDAEPSKAGLAVSNTLEVATVVARLPELELLGLMCIPLKGGDTAAFSRLRKLEERCLPMTRGSLSMGMSEDFEAAIAAGATHVRVGTRLFGARSTR